MSIESTGRNETACIPYVVCIFRYSYFPSFASFFTRLGGKESEQALTGISNGAMPVGFCSVSANGSRNTGIGRHRTEWI